MNCCSVQQMKCFHKYDVECKKPAPKHIMCDFIYMKLKNRQIKKKNNSNRQIESVVLSHSCELVGVTLPMPWMGFQCADQFSSVAQSCLTLCDPMDCSMPGLPVHYQLPEFTQTHLH